MAVATEDVVGLTSDALLDGLLQGGAWTFTGQRVLTYSFNVNFDYVQGQPVPAPGGSWSAVPNLQSAVVQALGTWASVANIGFSNVNSGNYVFESTADIALALTGNDLQQAFGAVALGFFPDPSYASATLAEAGYTRAQYPRPEGDVLIDNFYDGYSGANLLDGGLGRWALIHELGHALGLKHPFDDGGNARPTFGETGVGTYDNERYTVMSYSGIGASLSSGHAASPMPLDILAIQHIYGANMSFHAGDDTYVPSLDGAMRTIWDAGGIDTIDASTIHTGVTLDLRPGNLMDLPSGTVLGIAYNCTIENASTGAGGDTLYGNSANNTLAGGAGNNQYYGGAGDDSYIMSSDGDRIHENAGEGNDTVYASVSFDAFIHGSGMAGQIEHVVLTGNANLSARATSDTQSMTGNSGNNLLQDYYAAVTMAGGVGDDTYDVLGAQSSVHESAGQGFDTVRLWYRSSYTLPDEVERLLPQNAPPFGALVFTGNAQNNWIEGANFSADTLDGADGADTLVGNGGADVYVVDNAGDFIVEVADTAADLVRSSTDWTLHPGIENLLLTAAAMRGSGNASGNGITGNAAANLLEGDAGCDMLDGATGNDTLDGGTGFDRMTGGPGDDLFVVDTILPATGLVLQGEPGEYVSHGQSFYYAGGDGDFTVSDLLDRTADGQVDGLTLSFMQTGGDWWTLVFDTHQLGLNLLPGSYGDAQRAAFAQVGHAGLDVYGNGSGSNTLTGSFVVTQAQFGYTGPSATLLSFSASFEQHSESPLAPALRGTINFNAAPGPSEAVVERVGEGIDTVKATVSYTLPDNVENLVLTGAAATGLGNVLDNQLTGNASANLLAGGIGNDTLDGGPGADSLEGSPGFDVITGGEGNDTLRGGEQGDHLNGGDGQDYLSGGKGLDSLNGGSGDDTLVGGLGSDMLLGGDGIDTADYQAATESVTVNLTVAVAQFVSIGQANDTLLGIENLLGGSFSDALAGDILANRLFGNGGNDTMAADAGFDYLDGGDGNDNLNGGTNGDTLIGGLGDDTLGGGQGQDRLDGGDGNDTLIGGLGADTLAGGAGADHFRYLHALDGVTNIDTLTDFMSGVDVIELSVGIFGAFAGQVGQSIGSSAWLPYDPNTGVLAYDADGSGGNSGIIFAIIGAANHPPSLGNAFAIVA